MKGCWVTTLKAGLYGLGDSLTETKEREIQGLYREDKEGCSYATLLAKVILSQEIRKVKRRHISREEQKAWGT
jgi:hypothetical protein